MPPLAALLLAVGIASTIYWLAALACVIAFDRRRAGASTFAPAVSVLKPLCGRDPGLAENLESFAAQDYPDYQLVFGVRDPGDPAIDVVEALAERHPELDIALVVDDRSVGANPKINNVVNLAAAAKHDVLVLADGDIRVGRDYLRAVVSPLESPGTGIVTCLYRGRPGSGRWAALGALLVNDWFFPSALVGGRLGPAQHAFGATIAARREVLDAVGGFAAVADDLADDYALGRLVARHGWRVTLSRQVVDTMMSGRGLRAFVLHELRWARTLRAVRPLGYFFSVVTHGFPFALLAVALSGVAPTALLALAVHAGVRLVVAAAVRRALGAPDAPAPWLLPLRDALSLVFWALAFTGRTVHWRGQRFRVERRGRLRPAAEGTLR